MDWVYLLLAILFESIGTTLLKYSNGFSVLLPSIGTVVGYILCFFFLSLAFRTIDIGVAYAIWGAIGVVIITLVGIFVFHESVTPLKLFFIGLIIVGTVGLRLTQ